MEASYLSSHENVEWRIYCASCNCRYLSEQVTELYHFDSPGVPLVETYQTS